MRSKYVSPYKKAKLNQDKTEEEMILKAMYSPNEIVWLNKRRWKLIYAEVVDGELCYFATRANNCYFLKESALLEYNGIPQNTHTKVA